MLPLLDPNQKQALAVLFQALQDQYKAGHLTEQEYLDILDRYSKTLAGIERR